MRKEYFFYCYVATELIFYIFFGTDIIGINIKEYIFKNFPTWIVWLLLLLQIGLLLLLWPRKGTWNIETKMHGSEK